MLKKLMNKPARMKSFLNGSPLPGLKCFIPPCLVWSSDLTLSQDDHVLLEGMSRSSLHFPTTRTTVWVQVDALLSAQALKMLNR